MAHTDFVCPTPDAALIIEIAATLATQYQVSSVDLNKKTREIRNRLTKRDPNLINNISNQVENQITKWLKNNEEEITAQAIKRLEHNGYSKFTDEQLEATKRIETDIQRNHLTRDSITRHLGNMIREEAVTIN